MIRNLCAQKLLIIICTVKVLRLTIKATVQLCNVMDTWMELCGVKPGLPKMELCEDWQKSGRETGRSWTTGIGRPRASVAPRPGSGEEGEACCSSFQCFVLVICDW